MRASIQLWTLRDVAAADGLDAVVRLVAQAGFTAIEPFGLATTIDDVAPAVHELGLDVPTAHAELDTEDLDAVFDAAERLGTRTVIQHMFPAESWSADGLVATAAVLERAAVAGAARGIRVAVHHHDDELRTQVNGRPALLALADRLGPEVSIQVDVNWAALAGIDPVELVTALGEGVVAAHLKDGPGAGTNDEQVAPGRGQLDLGGFLAALPADAVVVLSLDAYRGDPIEAVKASRAWLDERGVR